MFGLCGVMIDMVSFKPVCRRCVDGVVWWLELIYVHRMGYIKKTRGGFNPYPANVENRVSS